MQFLHTYDTLKDLTRPDLKWGEEVEYGILKVCAKQIVEGSIRLLVT